MNKPGADSSYIVPLRGWLFLVIWVLMFPLTCAPLCAPSKPEPKIQRHDSVTASAGIPADQLRLEEECDGKIREAEVLQARGDATKALNLLDAAWQLAEKHPFLEGRRPLILRDRGRTYIQQQNFKAAVVAFSERLDLQKEQCRRKEDAEPYAGACAEAHMELGTAQVMLGSEAEALTHLREAIDCYRLGAQDKPDRSELVRLTHQYFQAQAMSMAGIASARLGKREEAKALNSEAIKILKDVINNPKADDPLKTHASQVLKFAEEHKSALN